MKLIKTFIKDLYVIQPELYIDNRGWFFESYNKKQLENFGINVDFVQDNHSLSKYKGTIRGLHFQKNPHAQSKLVRCTKGRVWDVAVDLRKSSSTYLKWFGVELSSNNKKMLFIPKGFAHGFITLENNSEVNYKVDYFFVSNSDQSLRYDDTRIGIKWPIKKTFISEKDKKAPYIEEINLEFL